MNLPTVCPKCGKKLFSRFDCTLGDGQPDPYCPICGWSVLCSPDPEAQAQHEAHMEQLPLCRVKGCGNRSYLYLNKPGMCYECKTTHDGWKRGARNTPPPFVEIDDDFFEWQPNPAYRGQVFRRKRRTADRAPQVQPRQRHSET